MKMWTGLCAIVFVFAACNPGKPVAAENFTVTLSRGSNFSVFAEGHADEAPEDDVCNAGKQVLNIAYNKCMHKAKQLAQAK